jgi:hypothetical protein
VGLTKKSQKANFTLLTEPADKIFLKNTDFLVSPGALLGGRLSCFRQRGGQDMP